MLNMVLIGNGVAAECIKRQLIISGLSNKINLTQVSADRFCSFNTTSVVAKRGTTRGLSDLGDLIVDSFEKFEEIFNENCFSGVSKSPLLHFCKVDSTAADNLKRRYSNLNITKKLLEFESEYEFFVHEDYAYIIEPNEFVSSLADNSKFNSYSNKKAIITNIENSLIHMHNEQLGFDLLIDCSGAKNIEYKHLDGLDLPSIKPLFGSYLKTQTNLINSAYTFTYEKNNLILRNNGELLIGSHSVSEYNAQADMELLASIYNSFNMDLNMNLPSFDEFEVFSSVRAKGQKMRPYCGKLSENIYMMNNLYKNGFSYPFVLSEKLVGQISNDFF